MSGLPRNGHDTEDSNAGPDHHLSIPNDMRSFRNVVFPHKSLVTTCDKHVKAPDWLGVRLCFSRSPTMHHCNLHLAGGWEGGQGARGMPMALGRGSEARSYARSGLTKC